MIQKSIKEILAMPENNPEGWLYLPPQIESWNLNTVGIFIEDSYDFESDSSSCLVGKYEDWIEILDNASIEDIVANARESLDDVATEEQIFDAFIFYFKNDAFKYN